MTVSALIPARLNSSRLEKKLIKDLDGIPIIVRTYKNIVSTNLFKARCGWIIGCYFIIRSECISNGSSSHSTSAATATITTSTTSWTSHHHYNRSCQWGIFEWTKQEDKKCSRVLPKAPQLRGSSEKSEGHHKSCEGDVVMSHKVCQDKCLFLVLSSFTSEIGKIFRVSKKNGHNNLVVR